MTSKHAHELLFDSQVALRLVDAAVEDRLPECWSTEFAGPRLRMVQEGARPWSGSREPLAGTMLDAAAESAEAADVLRLVLRRLRVLEDGPLGAEVGSLLELMRRLEPRLRRLTRVLEDSASSGLEPTDDDGAVWARPGIGFAARTAPRR
jgi:hypothetical protein